MKPLQIWLPHFDPAVSADDLWRDLQRAQERWRGESTVWLLPWLREPVRWTLNDHPATSELAIPSESLNRIDLFHVGENGYLHGNERFMRFAEPQIDTLLADWLNLLDGTEPRGLEQYLVPETVEFFVPRFDELPKIQYVPIEVPVEPAEILTLKSSQEEGAASWRWPPQGFPLPTVSPAAESRSWAGPLMGAGYLDPEQKLPTFGSVRNPKIKCMMTCLKWPEPFTLLFPDGGGADSALCLVRTKKVADKSEADRLEALREAVARGGQFVCEGQARLRDIWLHPIINQSGIEDALFALETKLSLPFATVEEALASERFQEKMRERVPIRRAIGIQGLFWSLLIEALEEGVTFKSCKRCGKAIQGRKTRAYCGKIENPECFRERRASDRRRARAKAG
jgi:hypothetical protein